MSHLLGCLVAATLIFQVSSQITVSIVSTQSKSPSNNLRSSTPSKNPTKAPTKSPATSTNTGLLGTLVGSLTTTRSPTRNPTTKTPGTTTTTTSGSTTTTTPGGTTTTSPGGTATTTTPGSTATTTTPGSTTTTTPGSTTTTTPGGTTTTTPGSTTTTTPGSTTTTTPGSTTTTTPGGTAIPSNPFFATTCPTTNQVYSAGGFPSSPYVITPFKDLFKNPTQLQYTDKVCRSDNHCMYSYEIDIKDIRARPFDNVIDSCRVLDPTWFLSYTGTLPGPTIIVPSGHESMVRFNNKISSAYFPNNITPCTPANGRSGVPISVHFHGSASLAPYDGWAEDETCGSETKDYVYPNNRPVTGWYHDHAVHVTADNAYHGLAGFSFVSSKLKHGGCGEPWNLEDIEELQLMLADKLIDNKCQLYADHAGAHQDNLYGDINMVSGIPFPLMNLQPKWYRLRLLNAAVSRPFLFQIRTEDGKAIVHQNICKVIAGDGGYRNTPANVPNAGVLLGVAERWEVVCDFSKYQGQTLYFWNDYDSLFMKDVPYFCYSHLLAKVVVSSTPAPDAPKFDLQSTAVATPHPINKVLSANDYQTALNMVAAGTFHREMKFGRTNGHWTINGETWDTFRIAAADVGQNTWELWKFSSGGGWFHPVHMHLVDFFIVGREGVGVKGYEYMTPKDVFYLGGGKSVYVIARFGAHRGQYMFHCHNLIHEDNDMMRAMNIMKGGANNKDTATQYYDNKLYGIIYDNFQYADPMLGDTAAKKSSMVSTFDTTYSQSMLDKNLYRIFYPTTDDKALYGKMYNPWESQWCPTP